MNDGDILDLLDGDIPDLLDGDILGYPPGNPGRNSKSHRKGSLIGKSHVTHGCDSDRRSFPHSFCVFGNKKKFVIS